MKTSSRYRAGWRGSLLSLLLTVSLALNLLGPVNGLPQKDGFIPICTGSEIIYIPLGDADFSRQTEDLPEPTSERCPWFAQFHAVEAATAPVGHSAVVYKITGFLPADTTAEGQQTPASFQARAPPARRA